MSRLRKHPKIKGVKCRFCHDTGITIPWDWYTYNANQFRELAKDDIWVECDRCDKSLELKKPYYGNSILRKAMIACDYGAPPLDLYYKWVERMVVLNE